MDAKHRPTALLVDDEPASRNAEQARLEGRGYTVSAAGGPSEGLAQAKQSAPDVIFVHLTSAGANVRFIQGLRADDACRHIPVAVIRESAVVQRSRLTPVPREAW